MPDRVTIRERDGVVIAVFPKEVDLRNIGEVRTQMFASLKSTATALVIDLSGTSYIDSQGVHLLLELARRLHLGRRRFALAVPPAALVVRLLDIAGLEIPRYGTLDAAVRAVAADEHNADT